jgi:hypothetical protein
MLKKTKKIDLMVGDIQNGGPSEKAFLIGPQLTFLITQSLFVSTTLSGHLNDRIPVASVLGEQLVCNQQHNVDDPPQTDAAQRQQLPDANAGLAQAKPVHSEESKQNAVQKRRDEIVVGVLDAWKSFTEEGLRPMALDRFENCAQHLGLLHLVEVDTAKLDAAMAQLIAGRSVALVIDGSLAFEELQR